MSRKFESDELTILAAKIQFYNDMKITHLALLAVVVFGQISLLGIIDMDINFLSMRNLLFYLINIGLCILIWFLYGRFIFYSRLTGALVSVMDGHYNISHFRPGIWKEISISKTERQIRKHFLMNKITATILYTLFLFLLIVLKYSHEISYLS